MHTFIEYRVRPVTRYVLTRFERVYETGHSEEPSKCVGGSSPLGEYDRADTAYHIGMALADNDQRRADECPAAGHEFEIVKPEHPDHTDKTVGYEVKPFTPV